MGSPRLVNKIIVHCSASSFGDVEIIDSWHKLKGWTGIGYHWVIGRGHAKGTGQYDPENDGKVEQGRQEWRTGAHVKGQNSTSIGVCLIGEGDYSEAQMDALDTLLLEIQDRHNVAMEMIFGHSDFDKKKLFCPGFDVKDWIKERRTF